MITGTGEAMIFSMMSRVESTNPPGVLISISTAWLWLAAADWRARSMYSAVMGWMASLTTILRTSAEVKEDRRETSAKAMTNRDNLMDAAAAALSPRAGLLRALFGRSYERRFNSIVPSYAPSCVRENSAVPPGLESFLPLVPALKRWAKLERPSGAGLSKVA